MVLGTVGSVLLDHTAVFEFGVVCEVFGIDRTDDGVGRFDLRVCGERPGEPLPTIMGVALTPEHGLDALVGVDLLAIPAYRIRERYPEPVLEAVRAAAGRGATLLSVCTGVFLLAAAGLLDGRPCTTHWKHVDEFVARFPAAKVDPDVLYVDDGDIITSAGTAAGIDACLHWVRREHGPGVATAFARRMLVAPQRDGGQRQFVQAPMPASADSLAPVLDWMLTNLEREHPVAELARRAAMSERTFARRFVAETGTTPGRWLTAQRVLHAQHLLEQTELSIDDIARRTGFGTPALLRHHFHRAVGLTPTQYRRTFACSPATT
jgi:transcriptional regulator GlxA family with amidase domain